MQKLTTLAAVALLSTLSTASLAQTSVTGTSTSVTTGPATASGSFTATGTLDGDILTLNYSGTNIATIPAGTIDVTGQVVVDFGTMTGTDEVLSCSPVSGIDLCGFSGVGAGPTAFDSVSGTSDSFTTALTNLGAVTTNTWRVTEQSSGGGGGVTITSDVAIPTLPLAGLGLLALGLAGLGARRLRK